MIYLKELVVKENQEFNAYPYNISLFKAGFTIKFTKNVTIISGENGSGKSTILKYIADNAGFNLDGGNANSSYASYTKEMNTDYIKLGWRLKTKKGFYFRSDTFDSYYRYIESDKEISQFYKNRFSELSHGESFLELFKHFHEGVFLIDEPESALSPQNQLALLKILHDLDINNKSQLIILTHSPIIMTYPNASFLFIENNQINEMNYKDTDHYIITKTMLDYPDKIFKFLFEEDI